jgi:hypothetical protein
LSWALIVFGGVAGLLIHQLHNIFLEVRSIRRMMNDDRNIPVETD